jgi:hypothetical protein
MKGEEAYLANVLNTMWPMPALPVHNTAATAACKHWQAPIDVMAVVAGIIMVELTSSLLSACLSSPPVATVVYKGVTLLAWYYCTMVATSVCLVVVYIMFVLSYIFKLS